MHMTPEFIPLTAHVDDRGWLMEVLRHDAPHFQCFGQAYVTSCRPGVIKAWHMHKHQTDYFCPITGMFRVAIVEPISGEEWEFVCGDEKRGLIIIPPLYFHGFKNIGTTEAVMLNIPTAAYNHEYPDEHRKSVNAFSYDWSQRHG